MVNSGFIPVYMLYTFYIDIYLILNIFLFWLSIPIGILSQTIKHMILNSAFLKSSN